MADRGRDTRHTGGMAVSRPKSDASRRRQIRHDLSRGPASRSAATVSHVTFGDRLAEFVARRESQLVLGLDPDPARLWPRALELVGGVDGASAPPAVRAARAVSAHCALVIDAVAEECVAVKPQVACFERLGAPGWEALAEVVAQRPRRRAAGDRRRQAWRHRRHRARVRAGIPRRDAEPVRRDAGPGC